ncbi:MAG TPA: lactonase family protein [Candidatus Udaeobacter sp.]|nr:lactonase family protein [Candidatus Udaeobacter sp.]
MDEILLEGILVEEALVEEVMVEERRFSAASDANKMRASAPEGRQFAPSFIFDILRALARNRRMRFYIGMTRFDLLCLFVCSLAFFVSAKASAAEPQKGKYLFYVGTYTESGSKSKGIYAYRYDAATQEITSLGLAAETTNPSWVALHPNGRFLYAVNEVQNYKGPNSGGVSAFSIDRATGKLTFLNEVASRGADPCYIIVDDSGKYVLVANYTGGNIATFPISADGKLGEASAFIQHTGHGLNPKRQEAAHAHSIDLSPDERFAFVDDLGLDQLLVYKFDKSKGSLKPNNPPFAKLDAGAGPRHFALHPSGQFGYVVSELASTVTAFSVQLKTGMLHRLQTVSTLPDDFKGENDDAEIRIHPSGKFLYASNRGHDSITVFAIDPAKGALTVVEHAPTQGKTPRSFEIDPTGTLLLAENQNSDSIVLFRIDEKTGKLTPTGKTLEVGQPVCVKFLKID